MNGYLCTEMLSNLQNDQTAKLSEILKNLKYMQNLHKMNIICITLNSRKKMEKNIRGNTTIIFYKL